jgi:cytochrome c553
VWKKILGYGVLTVLVIAGAGFSWLYLRKPASAAASDIKVAMTPERIERGAYLWKLGACDDCHSQHDLSAGEFRLVVSGRGRGQEFPSGKFGRVVASNLTPDPETGLGKWTDGEKIRAIREGISRDGRALFPIMPYKNFRYMSDDDVQSLVAYLNSMQPIRNPLPKTELKPMVAMMIKGVPRPVKTPVVNPDKSNRRLYGEYLVTLGNCESCHSPMQDGNIDATRRLAGGHRFQIGKYVVVSANITPHRETGIGNWTPEHFKARFARYKHGVPDDARGRFSVMPWGNLAQLADDDLQLIYEYLMQQPAIENKVDKYPVQLAKN